MRTRSGVVGLLLLAGSCGGSGGGGPQATAAYFEPGPASGGFVVNPELMSVEWVDMDGLPDLLLAGPQLSPAEGYLPLGIQAGIGDGTGGLEFGFANLGDVLADIDAPPPVVGHFDLDPHPDVVAFHQTGVTTTATLLHGAGDGTFERHLAFPVPLGIHASHIVAADVNGDGVDDLVIADHGMGVATVLSDGANGWSLPLLLNLVASPNSILSLVTADVDRDGDQDAIVLQSGGLVTVLDNDGTGSLAIASDFQVETLAQEIIVDDRHGPEYVAVFDRAPAAHVSIYPRDNQNSFEDSTMFAVDVQEGLDYCLAMVPVRSNIFRMPRVVVLAGNIQTGEIKAFLIRADSPSDPAVELEVPQGTPWRIAAGDLNLDLNEDLALFCVWQEGSGATATPHLAIETLLSTGQ